MGTDESGQQMGGGSDGYSGDEGPLRSVIDADGRHVYLQERISPGSQQTYLLDDPYQVHLPLLSPLGLHDLGDQWSCSSFVILTLSLQLLFPGLQLGAASVRELRRQPGQLRRGPALQRITAATDGRRRDSHSRRHSTPLRRHRSRHRLLHLQVPSTLCPNHSHPNIHTVIWVNERRCRMGTIGSFCATD